MDEHNAGTAPPEPTPPPTPYKDRSSGLVVFGVLTIILGCLAGLFVPLMVIGQMAAAKTTGAPTPLLTIVPAIAVYGASAVILIWLGIGSVMARRWARALLLILSWSGLIMGVLGLGFMVFLLPKMLAGLPAGGAPGQPAMPKEAIGIVLVFTALIFGVIFVILPAVWTFFYSSRHVKDTCEARDPVTRWTDGCPLPVLGFCVWLAFGALTMLIIPIAGKGVMPFFGVFITGVPGSLFCLAMVALWVYAAWSLYHLEQRGWWLILLALCFFVTSALITYARHDALEMYRLAGYPEAQLEQIQKSGLLAGNGMAWMTGCSMVPFLAYLCFIKKFLTRKH